MKTTNGLWYATMLVLTLALNTAQATPDEATVRGTASAIDEMLIQEKRPLMVMREGGRLERHWRKPIQLHRLVPIFSDMLAVEEATVRKALFRKRQKLSDMIFAHLLAEKSGLNFETVLRTHTNWLQALGDAEVTWPEIQRCLDAFYVEIAIQSLDQLLEEEQKGGFLVAK
ncbi:MAG: hypothetical protein AB1813_04335 [Verrucomicrobiota bacterium]|jgi:hypothetical protein